MHNYIVSSLRNTSPKCHSDQSSALLTVETGGTLSCVISTEAEGGAGNDPSGDPVGHSPNGESKVNESTETSDAKCSKRAVRRLRLRSDLSRPQPLITPIRNLNHRCSRLERARRSFRLTRSGRFLLRRMPHCGTASLAPLLPPNCLQPYNP